MGRENENRELIELISQNIVNDNLEEALELIYENESHLNNEGEFWNLKGILCTKVQEYNTALTCLETAVSKDKNNIDYLYNLAYIYEMLNKDFNAYYTYEKLISLVDDVKEKEELNKLMRNISNKNQVIIEKNTDDKSGAEFGNSIYTARENIANALVDDDDVLIDICIQGYNNLEKYTKTCVECVLKYTKDINYRLILIDNGSDDGTFEYFKSVNHPNKKIIRVTKNIGSAYGGNKAYFNCSAKYMMFVPNDLFVTENWLNNMLKCMESDNQIGMVVPASDYVSNYQSAGFTYSDFDDMQKKAAKYNKSDERMWEERIRLITLGVLFRKECLDVIGFSDYGFFHDFGDDDLSFRVRRAGYKTILCKDTFVSHAGKMTDKGAEFSANSIIAGRKIFSEKYNGIDAWEDTKQELGFINIVDTSKILSNDIPKILGIDTGCGQAILDVKNKLKLHNIFNTEVSAFSTMAKFFEDLNTICKEVYIDKIETMSTHFKINYFDYIVIGKDINEYDNPFGVLKNAMDLLSKNGQLLIKVKNIYEIITLLKILGIELDIKPSTAKGVDYIDVINSVYEYGGSVEAVIAQKYEGIDDISKNFFDLVEFKSEEARNHALVDRYVISITKGNKE